MTSIELTTLIEAPVETCFRLSLNIDLELRAARGYNMRAVSGVTSGTIGAGQRVGWKIRQFGIPVSHVSEITGYEAPGYFQDKMVSGMFRSFQHDHYFGVVNGNRCQMRDVMQFSLPWWMLGTLSERLVVRPRLQWLLRQRNAVLKAEAELA